MKKAVLAMLVLFLGFWLFTDPSGLADTSKEVGTLTAGGVGALFQAIIDFVGDL